MPHKLDHPSIPEGAITITSYIEMNQWVTDFACGKYRFIMLIGPPGISKSRTVKAAIAAHPYLYFENRASSFEIYRQMYDHIDEPIIVDDIDELYNDKQAVRLLKSLCNTDDVKTMQWTSDHPSIGPGDDQTPARYDTRSQVMLICNQWKTKDLNTRALEDRAQVLYFNPSPSEIHLKVSEWFVDTEVFSFIGDNLHLATRPSMRAYVKGSEQRRAGITTWKNNLLGIMGVSNELCQLVAIEADPTLDSSKARAERFESTGLGDRATYFRRKKGLPPPVDAALVKLASLRQMNTAKAAVAQSHPLADQSPTTKAGDAATLRLPVTNQHFPASTSHSDPQDATASTLRTKPFSKREIKAEMKRLAMPGVLNPIEDDASA